MKIQNILNVWVLKSHKKKKTLPVMYWIPKMHKNPTGARYIIVSKICSTKPSSTFGSNVFKFVYFQITNFHKNTKFLSNYNKFLVLQNSDPIIQSLNNINKKVCQIFCSI